MDADVAPGRELEKAPAQLTEGVRPGSVRHAVGVPPDQPAEAGQLEHAVGERRVVEAGRRVDPNLEAEAPDERPRPLDRRVGGPVVDEDDLVGEPFEGAQRRFDPGLFVPRPDERAHPHRTRARRGDEPERGRPAADPAREPRDGGSHRTKLIGVHLRMRLYAKRWAPMVSSHASSVGYKARKTARATGSISR